MQKAADKAVEKEIKVVCFNLGNEEYGLDVNCVLGVNPMVKITSVPKSPKFVEGVIRIREKIIPVIDLKKRLGITAVAQDAKSAKKRRIIITKAGGVRFGMIVDSVSEVISIFTKNIEPPSEALNHASLLEGVGKLEKRLILLLNLGKILSEKEREHLSGVHEKAKQKKK